MNTTGHPFTYTHKAGSLTTTIQKNSVKWLEVGAAFNEKKDKLPIHFLKLNKLYEFFVFHLLPKRKYGYDYVLNIIIFQ